MTALVSTAVSSLQDLLGDRFTMAMPVRAQYGSGESYSTHYPPDAVVYPLTTAETQAIASICHAHRVPMIASGACTSLEGHIAAPQGGLAINFARMDSILEVNADDLDCIVEPGVTREQLNNHLRDQGLFFPIDPGANATLGGMASTRASGTNAVRYGTMAQNVLGLTVVTADGRVIHTGGRARKSAAGYDLTRLYVGSEGTLGLITAIRLRLHGIAEAIISATCAFDDLDGAVETVAQMIQIGVPVARVEFLDDVQVAACNAYSGMNLPEKPHLFLEFHGTPASTQEQAKLVAELASFNGGNDFQWATSVEDRNRLWRARHNAYHAACALRPGATNWASDVCVPISALPQAVRAVRADIDANGLIAPIVGHVGDGNFHVQFLVDPARPEEMVAAKAVYQRMIEAAIAVGGTCTGEHGIGMVKQAHLMQEAGGEAIAAMRAIKRALDPLNLLNPGKIFQAEV